MRPDRTHQDYDEFVEKFKLKKTTDDCYTPPAVYDCVLEWVKEKYDINGCEIVRPFYPGGDYENYDYPDNCVVVDNPPFSITSKICRFYCEHNIRFFLFTNGLTLCNTRDVNWVKVAATITYENGAKVNTSFLTNMGSAKLTISEDLRLRLIAAQKRVGTKRNVRNYSPGVYSSAKIPSVTEDIEFNSGDVQFVSHDYNEGKIHLFGGGCKFSESALERLNKVKRS